MSASAPSSFHVRGCFDRERRVTRERLVCEQGWCVWEGCSTAPVFHPADAPAGLCPPPRPVAPTTARRGVAVQTGGTTMIYASAVSNCKTPPPPPRQRPPLPCGVINMAVAFSPGLGVTVTPSAGCRRRGRWPSVPLAPGESPPPSLTAAPLRRLTNLRRQRKFKRSSDETENTLSHPRSPPTPPICPPAFAEMARWSVSQKKKVNLPAPPPPPFSSFFPLSSQQQSTVSGRPLF